MELHVVVGLGGVRKTQTKSIRCLDHIFRIIMVMVGVALLMQWHLDWVNKLTPFGMQLFNWIIWSIFAAEVAVMFFVVPTKYIYFKRNWFKCFIVLSGLPLLFNIPIAVTVAHYARPILALLLLTPWFDFVKRSLTDNKLTTTLITVFAVIVISGFLISGIDPGIKTPLEGFWYVWVTLSTVGFGDLVPTSGVGRLFAGFLILIGLGFFSILTANFASLFLRRDMRQMVKDSQEIMTALKNMPKMRDEEKILKLIKEHDHRLEAMERHLNKKHKR